MQISLNAIGYVATLGDYEFAGFEHAAKAPAQEKREDGHVD